MNAASIPVTKLQDDFYDWYTRHDAKVRAAATHHYDLIFIGDSITHFFAGHPGFTNRGETVWQEFYGSRNALNLGFGWDRTQNVLWRLQHREFVGQTPKLIVLNIGTNNLTGTNYAPTSTPAQVAEAIAEIVQVIRRMSPATHILLMGVFPRGSVNDPLRAPVRELNALLSTYAAGQKEMTFMDIGPRFLAPDGELLPGMLPDQCHPSTVGYRVWAEAIEPVVNRFLPR